MPNTIYYAIAFWGRYGFDGGNET